MDPQPTTNQMAAELIQNITQFELTGAEHSNALATVWAITKQIWSLIWEALTAYPLLAFAAWALAIAGCAMLSTTRYVVHSMKRTFFFFLVLRFSGAPGTVVYTLLLAHAWVAFGIMNRLRVEGIMDPNTTGWVFFTPLFVCFLVITWLHLAQWLNWLRGLHNLDFTGGY